MVVGVEHLFLLFLPGVLWVLLRPSNRKQCHDDEGEDIQDVLDVLAAGFENFFDVSCSASEGEIEGEDQRKHNDGSKCGENTLDNECSKLVRWSRSSTIDPALAKDVGEALIWYRHGVNFNECVIRGLLFRNEWQRGAEHRT